MLGVGYLTTTQWPTLVDFDSSSQNIRNGSHSVICMPLIMQLNNTVRSPSALGTTLAFGAVTHLFDLSTIRPPPTSYLGNRFSSSTIFVRYGSTNEN